MKEIVIWVGEAWKVEEEEEYTLEYLEEVNRAMWENLHEEEEEED